MTRRNDRPSGWRCSVGHVKAHATWRAKGGNAAAEQYAQTRRRLRARIALKRAHVEVLEAFLHGKTQD